MDAQSSAFVVHATADDQVTNPSGESGDRIACGVFQASGAGLESAGETETIQQPSERGATVPMA